MSQEAVVAVIVRGDRLLIIRRADFVEGAGYWTPLSGKLEPGESQPSAVAREALEETGIQVRPIRKVWECPAAVGDYRLHWWLADYINGDLSLAPDEVSEAQWMRVEEFLALEKTFEDDRYFFERILPHIGTRGRGS